MKKIFSILLLVFLGLLSLNIVTLADDTAVTPQPTNNNLAQVENSGVNLYVDFSRANETTDGFYANNYTIGLDYNQDFLAGAYYSAGSNYGNFSGATVTDGTSQNFYMTYFGYNVLSQKNTSLGIIATYWDVYQKDNINTGELSAVGIGFKGAVNSGNCNLSLLYSYGISKTFKFNGTSYTDKTYMSLVELKGIYYFNDSTGIHAVYRWTPISSDYGDAAANYSCFGIGFDFKF